MSIIWHSIILSLLPIAELRGGIPYAVANDMGIVPAFFLCVCANILVIPIMYIFLETVHKAFYKVKPYQRIFDKYIERTRKKGEKSFAKYGYWGIMLFVAIPLPVTGAYTGTAAAWILRLQKRKSFLYLALGVVIAGVIVSIATMTGLGLLKIFIK